MDGRGSRLFGLSKPLSQEAVTGILVWGAVLIVGLLAAGFVFVWLRRRLFSPPGRLEASPWTLDGLRQLRAEGLIGDEEYTRLRQGVIDAFRDRPTEPAPETAPPAKPPVPSEPAPPTGPASGPAPSPPADPANDGPADLGRPADGQGL